MKPVKERIGQPDYVGRLDFFYEAAGVRTPAQTFK